MWLAAAFAVAAKARPYTPCVLVRRAVVALALAAATVVAACSSLLTADPTPVPGPASTADGAGRGQPRSAWGGNVATGSRLVLYRPGRLGHGPRPGGIMAARSRFQRDQGKSARPRYAVAGRASAH